MLKQALLPVCVSLLIIGCAGTVGVAHLTPDHPASPDAPEASFADPSGHLRPDAQDATKTGPSASSNPGSTMGGGTGSSRLGTGDEHGMHLGEETMGTQEGSGGHPQPSPTPGSRSDNRTYTCPMHPEIVRDKPGTCPKCGMTLVRKEPKEERR